MIDKKPKTEWHIISASVQGLHTNVRDNPIKMPFASSTLSGDNLPLIMAVSDGHGGAKYFRSDKGARFAVEAAIETLPQFQDTMASFLTSSKTGQEEHLIKSLVNTWRSKVNTHFQDEPFTNEELRLLEEKEGSTSQQIVEGNPVLAYGATILVIMITESFIAYLQLGDGDILTVSEQGKPESVFPVYSKHFANETTSLCSSNAWCDFQFRIEKISSSSALPALILLSTDGYKDSFSSSKAFLKVGSDLLEMLHANKLEEIKSNLQGWLSEASRIGSGDDITLGILYRMEAFKDLDAPQSSEQAQENHIEGESLELDAQSGHCDGPLQLQIADFRNTPGEKTGGKPGGEKAKGKAGGKPGKKTK